ncbi:MAG: single-stranded-DNA-specific exonuclease RecJ [Syntrophomonadaceae bacterium]
MQKQVNISSILAKLLVQRGIKSGEDTYSFFNKNLDVLSDPLALKGMQQAVNRIIQAIESREKVVIFGDYDADGICSIALLVDYFKAAGLKVDYYVPDRFTEGYGLNQQAVENLAAAGYQLIITVDCGISSFQETELAKSLGMEVIITDHHTPPSDNLPQALAVINPWIDQVEASKYLAGAGVAFQLIRALSRYRNDELAMGYLDLVALATIADMVPLLGDNRIIVYHGLNALAKTKKLGLKALIKEAGLEDKSLLPWHIGFLIAPRLNSAGRLQNASTSIELLLAENEVIAQDLAARLTGINNERRMLEEKIYKEAVLQIETSEYASQLPVLVVSGDDWHQGVIGIVASRLCNRYNRPVIMIAWEGDIGRGSCRSPEGINIYNILDGCRDLLVKYGGHSMAAGLVIEKQHYRQFEATLSEWSLEPEKDAQGCIYIDAEVEPEDINQGLYDLVEQLQPFGEGNPIPCFLLRGVEVRQAERFGKNKEHFKALIGPNRIEGIAFGGSDLVNLPFDKCLFDILFELERNQFRGKNTIRLKIKDIKNSILSNDIRDPRFFSLMLRQILQELDNGKPVLVAYPTHRVLSKHSILLKTFFSPSVLKPLHGKLIQPQRIAVETEFKKGAVRVFLTTYPYLQYYCQDSHLPGNLERIIYVGDHDGYEKLKGLGPIKVTALTDNSKRVIWERKDICFNTKPAFVYANRSQTITEFSAHPRVMVEAGLTNVRQRRIVRQRFREADSTILLTDGNYTDVLDNGHNIETIFFADIPYSRFEAFSMISQIAASKDTKAVALFNDEDLIVNRNYLKRQYPDLKFFKQVWSCLISFKVNPITEDIRKLASIIEKALQLRQNSLDLGPFFHILTDLGLCEVKKKGSIISIKFIYPKSHTINLRNSPYYLEGKAEIEAFNRWEKELRELLGDHE